MPWLSLRLRAAGPTLAAVLFIAPSASPQCNGDWQHFEALSPLVDRCALWDSDGAGPAEERVVAVGFFQSIDGAPANGVGVYDELSGTWSGLGAGLGYEVVDASGAPNGDLVVGGLSLAAEGRVDVWNGTTWSTLPALTQGGQVAQVASLTVLPNGDIIAGGSFSMAGGVPVNNVARWDGASWNDMAGGIDGLVRNLELRPNGDVVAGSLFVDQNSNFPTGFARWNGTSWSAMGAGATTTSLGVADFSFLGNGDILASGAFAVGGPPMPIALWNGSDWQPLGAGINGPVTTVALLPSGDFVAAGAFSMAGGVSADNVARWDGSAWSEIGSGLGSQSQHQVLGIIVDADGSVFAGGFFTDGSGQATNLASIDCAGTGDTLGTSYCTASPNSASASGALLTALGSASASPLNLTLTAQPVPNTPGLFFFGPNQLAAEPDFGEGVRCVGGATSRIFPLALAELGLAVQ